MNYEQYLVVVKNTEPSAPQELIHAGKMSAFSPEWEAVVEKLLALQPVAKADIHNIENEEFKLAPYKIRTEVICSELLFACSEATKQLFQALNLPIKFIPFPLIYRKKNFPYFLLEVPKAEVMDLSKSEVLRFEGSQSIRKIQKLAIHKGHNFGPVVRCGLSKLIFFRRDIADELSKHKISGLVLKEIDETNEKSW